MSKRDYYDVLGVGRTVGDEELKKSFRRLAMKCHPDRCPDDPAAQDKFKEAKEAYEVLSDSRKRASLRMWAWSSGGWLVLQVIVVIAIAVSISHSSSVDRSGPCVGGPDPSATGKDISGNGTRFVVPCTFSGTATVSFP